MAPSQPDPAVVERYRQLRDTIEKADRAYFQDSQPILADADYDQLRAQALELEQRHSYLPELLNRPSLQVTIGAPPESGFRQHQHRQPMLSLDNAHQPEDVAAFIAKISRFLDRPSIDCICEAKIDGLSASLTYENGQLTRGLTRGDGLVGEDVTANLMTINDIPRQLAIDNPPSQIEIRGEVYLDTAIFADYNAKLIKDGQTPYANPRNAASGALRQRDPRQTAERQLSFFAYACGAIDGALPVHRQSELLAWLGKAGFPICGEYQTACVSPDAIQPLLDFYQRFADKRRELNYETDGVVIKVDDFQLQQRLGTVGRAPRWATAFKFAPPEATATLHDVAFSIGRTGVLTPVAILSPTSLGGVTVTRASLHNPDFVEKKQLAIGCRVSLIRSGDVIPYVVAKTADQADQRPIPWPSHCPECQTELIASASALRCPNRSCVGQMHELLRYFVSRTVVDIAGIGDKSLRQLKTWLKQPADLFLLAHRKPALLALEGWSNRSVDSLLNQIDRKRAVSLPLFLLALGIASIGQETARLLARTFKTWTAIRQQLIPAQREALIAIEGIGEKTADLLIDEFGQTLERHDRLARMMTPLPWQEPSASSPLSGKKIVLTGALTQMTRQEAKTQIAKLGAHIQSAVSAQTDWVIAGEKAGSKLKKATQLGLSTLNETEFLAMLKQSTTAAQPTVTPQDIAQAAETLTGGGWVLSTPLLRSPILDQLFGAHVLLKAENLQTIGAFKQRGAFYAIARLLAEERQTQAIAAWSSGNHAQAVAMACQFFGLDAHIVIPENASPLKIEMTKRWGANVILSKVGEREKLGAETADRYNAPVVHPYENLDVITGQGTCGFEIVTDPHLLDLDRAGKPLAAVYLPTGGGGLAAGVAIAVHHRFDKAEIVAIKPEGYDTLTAALQSKPPPTLTNQPTVLDAITNPVIGKPNLPILKHHQVRAVSVSDHHALQALATIVHALRVVVEPSAAAALFAAYRERERWQGQTVVVILSGGNLDKQILAQALTTGGLSP